MFRDQNECLVIRWYMIRNLLLRCQDTYSCHATKVHLVVLCYKYIISCNYFFLWSFLYMTFDSTHTQHAAHIRRAIYSTCSSRFNHLFYFIILIARVVLTTILLHPNIVYCYFHWIVVCFHLSIHYHNFICSSLFVHNFTQTRSQQIQNYTTTIYYMLMLRSSHVNCLFICLLKISLQFERERVYLNKYRLIFLFCFFKKYLFYK